MSWSYRLWAVSALIAMAIAVDGTKECLIHGSIFTPLGRDKDLDRKRVCSDGDCDIPLWYSYPSIRGLQCAARCLCDDDCTGFVFGDKNMSRAASCLGFGAYEEGDLTDVFVGRQNYIVYQKGRNALHLLRPSNVLFEES